jgi:putative DNA primase/helicase
MNQFTPFSGTGQATPEPNYEQIIKGRLNRRHLADLQTSGLSFETIFASGCFSATAEEVQTYLGFPSGPGLALPYYVPDERGPGRFRPLPDFVRIKPDEPFTSNGREARYLSPRGSTNHLYFPPNLPLDVLADSSLALLITEGEKKGLAAVQEGIPCIAIPGVWSYRMRTEDGDRILLPDFDLINWKGRCVTILFDSDLQHNEHVYAAQQVLAEELFSLGALVYTNYLPELEVIHV